MPYTVPGYPTGDNAATGLPWAPATDGLRNITGRVNRDGTVTIWAITSTVSGGGDQGADPNKLVAITDKLAATTLPARASPRWRPPGTARPCAGCRSPRARGQVSDQLTTACGRRRPWRPAPAARDAALPAQARVRAIRTGAPIGFVYRKVPVCNDMYSIISRGHGRARWVLGCPEMAL